MSLIILLILSEDECYIKSIHEIILPLDDVLWYKEKALVDCTLGSLILLILIRTIQANMLKYKDQYLHTNCMSVLGNLSYKMRLIHPYVVTKYLKLFQSLTKKNSTLSKIQNNDLENLNYSESKVVKHVLKTLFNVLAVSLANNLFSNVELIYGILYFKEVFLGFHTDLQTEVETYDKINSNNNTLRAAPTSPGAENNQDDVNSSDVSALNLLNSTGLIISLELIKFFDKKFNEMNKNDNNKLLGAEAFKSHVGESLKVFPKRFLLSRPLSDLKYNYIEEECPEDYFIPLLAFKGFSEEVFWSKKKSKKKNLIIFFCPKKTLPLPIL